MLALFLNVRTCLKFPKLCWHNLPKPNRDPALPPGPYFDSGGLSIHACAATGHPGAMASSFSRRLPTARRLQPPRVVPGFYLSKLCGPIIRGPHSPGREAAVPKPDPPGGEAAESGPVGGALEDCATITRSSQAICSGVNSEVSASSRGPGATTPSPSPDMPYLAQ